MSYFTVKIGRHRLNTIEAIQLAQTALFL